MSNQREIDYSSLWMVIYDKLRMYETPKENGESLICISINDVFGWCIDAGVLTKADCSKNSVVLAVALVVNAWMYAFGFKPLTSEEVLAEAGERAGDLMWFRYRGD